MATKPPLKPTKPLPVEQLPVKLRPVQQITRNCSRGESKDVDLSGGRPLYAANRLLLLVNADVVERPHPTRPIGLPPEIMKAFVFMRGAFSLRRVESVIQTGHRLYLEPAQSAPEGLTNGERAILHSLVMPLGPAIPQGPAIVAVPLEAAAIEMTSRVQLTFRDPRKVQAAADFLCTVPNIIRVERPACAYATSVSTDEPPPPPDIAKTVGTYNPEWWQEMTAWKYIDPSAKSLGPSRFDSTIPIQNIAVLDSGVDTSGHPCLNGAYRLPIRADFPFSEVDRYGHGTHVLSIISGRPLPSAKAKDGTSLSIPGGALPKANVLSFNVFEDEDVTAVDMQKLKTALFVIRYYYTKIKVVNLSIWMEGLPDWDLQDEINQSVATGLVPCVCAGNQFDYATDNPSLTDSSFRVQYPARLKSVLSVGAVTRTASRDTFSRFSTWGQNGSDGNDSKFSSAGRKPLLSLSAPGRLIWGAMIQEPVGKINGQTNIVELNGGHKVAWLNGTSMATPMVSAAAGYIHHHWQQATAFDVRKAILHCVDKSSISWQSPLTLKFQVTFQELYGTGVLDFHKVGTLAGTPFQFVV